MNSQIVATAAPDRMCGRERDGPDDVAALQRQVKQQRQRQADHQAAGDDQPVKTMVIHSVLWKAGSVSTRP